jgi:hypothetical protein
MSEILYFKLVSGDDIVASVIDEDEDSFHLAYPLKFIFSRDMSTRAISTGIIPWIPIDEIMGEIVSVNKYNVIAASEVPESMRILYEKLYKESNHNEQLSEDMDTLYEKIQANPELQSLLIANTNSKLIH